MMQINTVVQNVRERKIGRLTTLAFILVATNSIFSYSSVQAATEIDQLPVRGEWVRTSDAPLTPRNGPTIAWTGSEILVFGGDQYLCSPAAECMYPSNEPFSDGAVYDPLYDTWRMINDAPVGIRAASTATIDGEVFVLVHVPRPMRLLRYVSALDDWDEINLPENITAAAIAPFGRNIVVYTATDERGQGSDWLFNTINRQWKQLPDDPLGPGFSRQFIAHDNDLYLFDHALVRSPGGADGPSYLRAARLREERWEVLDTSDSIGSAPTLIAGDLLISPILGCADGGEINNYGRCIPYGAVFNTLTDTWHEIPNAPDRGEKLTSYPGGLSENKVMLSIPGYPALDTLTNEWFIVPKLDNDRNIQRSIKAVGSYGFAFGGSRFTREGGGELLNESWLWKP